MKASKKRKEYMYSLVEKWENSNKSQRAISEEAGISFHVFRYWVKKQKAEQLQKNVRKSNPPKNKTRAFYPISLSPISHFEKLQIIYPNGVKINCPSSVTTNQLQDLIKLF